ncbi:DinB family protein [Pararhizobium sp. A13]|uniref:DinB family protein n=1 Tax=Pararhizobium sp. A13 TaxID=3133975 RepID=UPI003248547F
MTALLQKLFGYHAWANNDLFDKLETLDQAQHKSELHTALRLINHYHVVAQIFAANLSGVQHNYASGNTAETPTLDELRAALASSDQWYLNYLRSVPPANLRETIPFAFTDGDKGYMSREEMLTHVALHGGYHRGEVGRLLWQLSVTPPWDTFAVYLHQTEPGRRLQGGEPSVSA